MMIDLMGKHEGLKNKQKRKVHDAWLADKKDQRLSWYVHENVNGFPGKWIIDELAPKYKCEECLISPQRFGKPMNRQWQLKQPML
ncbi:unnamed protein product [Durusdinium trenchii]|uniref:Uncharacterized protein n=1 Tax=Durusdinium trenchii TaxID=1381693 RepID=A0ABP0RBU9_9DINO